MKLIAPSYFNDFKCIAGACRHSCCVGWEIDVDPVSYLKYMNLPGEFGEKLREHLEIGEGGPYFRMTEDGRCPFLNGEGLCDMIITLGEDSLCQICDDHPRFRNFFSDREEIGLGMCCEAAGRLILGYNEPVKFFAIESDEPNAENDDFENELLDIRESVIEGIQDRSAPIMERVCALMKEIGVSPDIDYAHWAQCLMGLERLDEKWLYMLEEMQNAEFEYEMGAWEVPLEQLMVYLLYRHVPAALDDECIDLHIAFCCIMWLIVRKLCAIREELTFEDMVEICRMYSSEIEYSDENIDALLAIIAV